MLSDKELKELHTNQRLLVIELQSRGIDVKILLKEMELLEAEYKGHKELILDRDSSINPYASSVISGNKYLTKMLLQREGLSVVSGRQFFSDETDNALIYAQELGFPVVVKPVFGSHGFSVCVDLEDLSMVKSAIESTVRAIGTSRAYIVEEQFEGKEYRVFVTRDGNYAVLHRDPSHVIGDGKRTIEQLANDETKMRTEPKMGSNFSRKTCLCPVALDDVASEYLKRSGRTFNSVPDNGEKVYLRKISNVAMGGTCEDYTDKVHPSVIEIARRALAVFTGLPYAGIDFLSKEIDKPQLAESYRILEVNSVPGVHMHMQPGTGLPRNVAKYIADMMYPETRRD